MLPPHFDVVRRVEMKFFSSIKSPMGCLGFRRHFSKLSSPSRFLIPYNFIANNSTITTNISYRSTIIMEDHSTKIFEVNCNQLNRKACTKILLEKLRLIQPCSTMRNKSNQI
ncbi:hypothetical protein ABFX02_06G019400 [Erythranthe guttata]